MKAPACWHIAGARELFRVKQKVSHTSLCALNLFLFVIRRRDFGHMLPTHCKSDLLHPYNRYHHDPVMQP